MPAGQRLVEVGLEPVAVAVDDALAEALLDRPAGLRSSFTALATVTPANTSSSFCSGS